MRWYVLDVADSDVYQVLGVEPCVSRWFLGVDESTANDVVEGFTTFHCPLTNVKINKQVEVVSEGINQARTRAQVIN